MAKESLLEKLCLHHEGWFGSSQAIHHDMRVGYGMCYLLIEWSCQVQRGTVRVVLYHNSSASQQPNKVFGEKSPQLWIQSDPNLPGSSGETVLPGKSGCPVYRGQILSISYIGGS